MVNEKKKIIHCPPKIIYSLSMLAGPYLYLQYVRKIKFEMENKLLNNVLQRETKLSDL